MKKLLVTLTILVTPGIALAAFTDTGTHPYRVQIDHVQSLGIVQGYSDGSFKPNATINRAEFTKIVIEANYSESDIASCNLSSLQFSDVAQSDWYAKYVCTATQHQIIQGYLDGTFRPSATINFAESAKIIALAEGIAIPETGGEWFTKYITAIELKRAIPSPKPAASDSMTRGQMAYIISKLKTYSEPKQSGVYEDFSDLVLRSGQEFILFFNASWCPSCKKHRDYLASLESYPVSIYRVDYDTSTDVRTQFAVTSQDTFLHVNASGEVIKRMVFPTDEELEAYLLSL